MEKIKKINSGKESPKINDLIFKELIKRGYSLEGKNKVWNIADSRFWYLTSEQAKAFLNLERKDTKQKLFANKEMELIKSNFSNLIMGLENKKINVIDLGCGDGLKGMSFVKQFKNKSNVRYCPIDINEFMIKETMNNFSKLKNVDILKLKNNIIDFVDFNKISSSIKNNGYKVNYLLLLGGNLENSDAHELLHEIRTAMHEGDVLLIGNKLAHPDHNKMVQYYNHNKHIDSLLVKTIEQLGINKELVQYEARFRGNRIEMLYIFKEDKTISSGWRKVEFKAGDKIIVTISYKYGKDALMGLLKMYFDDVELFVSKDNVFVLALCKK